MASPRPRRPIGRLHRLFLGSQVPTAPADLTPFWAAAWVVSLVFRRLVLGDHRLAWRFAMAVTAVIVVAVIAGSLVYVGVGTVAAWGWQHR